MTPEQQKKMIREFMFAMDRGDFAALSGMIRSDFEMEMVASAPGIPNRFDRFGFLEILPPMLAQMFPQGFNYTCGDALADGVSASMQGTCNTVTGGGKRYVNQYHWFFRFADDKIVLFREFLDSYATVQAMA